MYGSGDFSYLVVLVVTCLRVFFLLLVFIDWSFFFTNHVLYFSLLKQFLLNVLSSSNLVSLRFCSSNQEFSLLNCSQNNLNQV